MTKKLKKEYQAFVENQKLKDNVKDVRDDFSYKKIILHKNEIHTSITLLVDDNKLNEMHEKHDTVEEFLEDLLKQHGIDSVIKYAQITYREPPSVTPGKPK